MPVTPPRGARLTHLDAARRPTMVNVGAKPVTHRVAEAVARLQLPAAVARALRASGHRTRKGPVFDTAIVAGVMAAKRTWELIPFCHPLPLEQCEIRISAAGNRITVHCRVEVHHRTGVEMEALTGASTAALTIYDMCKALSHDIRIVELRLLMKRGGQRDVATVSGAAPRPARVARTAPARGRRPRRGATTRPRAARP